MGAYRLVSTKDAQVAAIRANGAELLGRGALDVLLTRLVLSIAAQIDADHAETPLAADWALQYHALLTIVYILLCVALADSAPLAGVRQTVARSDPLLALVRFIEHWKWFPRPHYRLRLVVAMVWKLMLVEFGDSRELAECDRYLERVHGIAPCAAPLACLPVDYFTFREDLGLKYPLYDAPQAPWPPAPQGSPLGSPLAVGPPGSPLALGSPPGSPLALGSPPGSPLSPLALEPPALHTYMAFHENSNSLTNLIEMPRTNRSHTLASQLPAQTVHIATPVPSPPTTPSDYMSGGEKIRKLYHVNQAMPFIYPTGPGDAVPYAIKEADEILRNCVHETLAHRQLWQERQAFMRQERGFADEYDGEAEASTSAPNEPLLTSAPTAATPTGALSASAPASSPASAPPGLARVEHFYSTSLLRLHALVEVLLHTVSANRFDLDLNVPEWQLNAATALDPKRLPDTAPRARVEELLMRQLERALAKETTLKAASAILSLMLRWFERSHVLKRWYLASLVFDQKYLAILVEFLDNSFVNPSLQQMSEGGGAADQGRAAYQNKVMNPRIVLPRLDLFNNCLQRFPPPAPLELINKRRLHQFGATTDRHNVRNIHVDRCNRAYCFALTNLLEVADLVLLEDKTQRILTLSDLKPSDVFKLILTHHDNDHVSPPILRMLKKLIPYQGRKWKSNNMDLISKVYLGTTLGHRDNWLSGRDLENDFNNSYGQELAVRGLLQFYNMRRYPHQMRRLGYEALPSNE